MANDKTYVTEIPFSEVKKYKENYDKFLEDNKDFLAKNAVFPIVLNIDLGKDEEIDAELPDLDTVTGMVKLQSSKERMKGYLEKHINAEVEKKLEKERYKIEKEIRSKFYIFKDK